jgi:hypothetical protein
MVAATIVFEGTAAEVALQEKVVAATAKRFGGIHGAPQIGGVTYVPRQVPTMSCNQSPLASL